VILAQLGPETGAQLHAKRETLEIEFFVGRMRVIVGQGQTQQQRIGAQDLLELIDDGD